jgi:hypothetical protein
MRLPRVSTIFKKFSPKTFGLHCVLITPCINCRGTLKYFNLTSICENCSATRCSSLVMTDHN